MLKRWCRQKQIAQYSPPIMKNSSRQLLSLVRQTISFATIGSSMMEQTDGLNQEKEQNK